MQKLKILYKTFRENIHQSPYNLELIKDFLERTTQGRKGRENTDKIDIFKN